MPASNELSERELEILRLIATGASNKEVALKLNISANTVKVHLRNIFAKIEVASRTEAALYAVSSGLVSSGVSAVALGAEEGGNDLETGALPGSSGASVVGETPELSRRSWLWSSAGAFLALLVMVSLLAAWLLRPKTPSLTELPSPADSTRWQILADMPTPRFGLAVAGYQNQILAIGGETVTGVTGMVERYEPGADAWSELASKPTPVADAGAAVIGGKVYVPGGRTASGAPTAVLEIFDSQANTWQAGASLPVALSAYALAAYEGKLYLFGGWDGTVVLREVYSYDPAEDAWTQRASMPTARAFAGAAVAGEKVFVIGGTDGKRSLRANESYQPSLDHDGGSQPWGSGAALPAGRYGMGVVSLADIIHVIGGIEEKGQALSLEYFPQNDRWLEFGSLGERGWSNLGVVALGPNMHVLGGKLDGAPTGSNLAYQAIYMINMPIIK